MRGYTLYIPYILACPTWVALPGAYVPASIALRVIGVRKSPLHEKAIVFDEAKNSIT
jgi:hypothetical protein